MILLTNTRHSLVGLDGYDLSIVGELPIEREAD
jgi:3,4-dihydroxy 2-butanone 4-phosphate synthase/GTP cyclohydrolase II